MNFAGLPNQCPPLDHATGPLKQVYRVLAGSAPSPLDWQSHLQRGKAPIGDPCRFASISLMLNPRAAKSLKNLQHLTHAAELDIPANYGAHVTKNNHVDFWCAAGNCLSKHVVAVVAI